MNSSSNSNNDKKSDAKPICSYCGKTLAATADSRKNGTTRHTEWMHSQTNPRTMHKKCWTKLRKNNQWEQSTIDIMTRLNEER